jgi:hypothetical protein
LTPAALKPILKLKRASDALSLVEAEERPLSVAKSQLTDVRRCFKDDE